MGFLPLLWSHRRAMVLSAVVAVLVAVPFGLIAPASYTATSTILLSANEPAIDNAHGETVLSLRLMQYTDNDYEGAVLKALGKQADGVSVTANQSKTDPIEYDLSVAAGSAKKATASAKVASKVLIDRYSAITTEEVDKIEHDVTGQLGSLTAKKSALDGQVAAKKTEFDTLQQQVTALDGRISSIRAATAKDVLAGNSAASAAADRAIAPIQAQKDPLLPQLTARRTELDALTSQSTQVDTEQTTLLQALSNARKTYLAGQAASNVAVLAPPTSNTLLRVLESVGLGLVLAVLLSCVSIVWLERSPVWRWVKRGFHRAVDPKAPASDLESTEPEVPEQAVAPTQPSPQPEPGPPSQPFVRPEPLVPAAPGDQGVSAPARDVEPAAEDPEEASGPPLFVRDI